MSFMFNLWTVTGLTCLYIMLLPLSTSIHNSSCWFAGPSELHSGFFNVHKPCQSTSNLCAISTSTGLGIGCVTNQPCPTGNYKPNQLICNTHVCCCENHPPNQFPSCNYLNSNQLRDKACAIPELSDSAWCQPKIICRDINHKNITCDDNPVVTPYSKMDANTGIGLGCGTIKNQSYNCPNTHYFENEVVCVKGKCCCKGNDKEPCNIITDQVCQLHEFKELKECPGSGLRPVHGVSTNASGNQAPRSRRLGSNLGSDSMNEDEDYHNDCGGEDQKPCAAAGEMVGLSKWLVLGMLYVVCLTICKLDCQ